MSYIELLKEVETTFDLFPNTIWKSYPSEINISPTKWQVEFSYLTKALESRYKITAEGRTMFDWIVNKQLAQQVVEYAQRIEVMFI